VISAQGALASTFVDTGEGEAKDATDAVDAAVAAASKEAESSEAQATQEAAASEAAAFASSTAKDVADEAMAAAQQQAAQAENTASSAAASAESTSSKALTPEMGLSAETVDSPEPSSLSLLRRIERQAEARSHTAMDKELVQVERDRNRAFTREEEGRSGMVSKAVAAESSWETANGLYPLLAASHAHSAHLAHAAAAVAAHAAVTTLRQQANERHSPLRDTQKLGWDPKCPCRGGCPCAGA
jgi:hypothetical protein